MPSSAQSVGSSTKTVFLASCHKRSSICSPLVCYSLVFVSWFSFVFDHFWVVCYCQFGLAILSVLHFLSLGSLQFLCLVLYLFFCVFSSHSHVLSFSSSLTVDHFVFTSFPQFPCSVLSHCCSTFPLSPGCNVIDHQSTIFKLLDLIVHHCFLLFLTTRFSPVHHLRSMHVFPLCCH